ncbi:AAA family ATPase [Hyphomonas sp.]|jgi:DNA repair exonuclease SbcCD ATPase subunit|uniref:AAA family ATPase n=1 Tax=Hyphomonas sp. TaxID=87 RepID=UPI0032D95796
MSSCLTRDSLSLTTPDGTPLFDGLTLSVHGRLGHLAQIADETQTVAETLGAADGLARLARMAAGEGTVERLTSRISRLDQQVSLLPSGGSILDAIRAVQPLSGGERLRAGLASIFAAPEPPELLLLDEPTNHLDMDAIETLETALKAYDGALLVISHDPAFLDAIGITHRIALP